MASWHHHFRRQDLKPFRHHLSSCDRLSDFYPWVAAVGNRVVKHHLSPDLLALKRCSLNWRGQIVEKKQSSVKTIYHVQSIFILIIFICHFLFFMFMFSFVFLVAHQSDPHLQSHHAVSWRNHSPLALRKWHLQPISQTAKPPNSVSVWVFWHPFRECKVTLYVTIRGRT